LNRCVERSEEIVVEAAKGPKDTLNSLRGRGNDVSLFDDEVKGWTTRNDVDLNA
jgi:hypothetical protein